MHTGLDNDNTCNAGTVENSTRRCTGYDKTAVQRIITEETNPAKGDLDISSFVNWNVDTENFTIALKRGGLFN